MFLSKFISKLRRKSRVLPSALQSTSEPTFKSYCTSSSNIERPATAMDQSFSNSYHRGFTHSAGRIIKMDEVSPSQSATDKDLVTVANRESHPVSDKDSSRSNLDFSTSGLQDIRSPTQLPCSTPYDVNGYRVSRFYEHLHSDDAYKSLTERGLSAPEGILPFRNTMNASSQTVPLPTLTGLEQKDSIHRRNNSFPVYPGSAQRHS